MKLTRRREIRTWRRSILLPFLRLTPPTDGFPRGDLRKIFHEGQRMAMVQNGEEILAQVSTPWVGRTNVTDDRRICDSKDSNITYWLRSGKKLASRKGNSLLWTRSFQFQSYKTNQQTVTALVRGMKFSARRKRSFENQHLRTFLAS